ncbi:MAG: hypothetical protein WCR72_13790 [Bacteroidota bacterium]
METRAGSLELLFEKAEIYGKTTIELSKLRLLETATTVVSALIAKLSVVIMVAMFVLVLSVGVALMLGELLGKSFYGFFIVAAFYLLAGMALHFFLHRWIRKPVSEIIIKQALQ